MMIYHNVNSYGIKKSIENYDDRYVTNKVNAMDKFKITNYSALHWLHMALTLHTSIVANS
jgi:hypothetical protein